MDFRSQYPFDEQASSPNKRNANILPPRFHSRGFCMLLTQLCRRVDHSTPVTRIGTSFWTVVSKQNGFKTREKEKIALMRQVLFTKKFPLSKTENIGLGSFEVAAKNPWVTATAFKNDTIVATSYENKALRGCLPWTQNWKVWCNRQKT